jgi:hypothetical protein
VAEASIEARAPLSRVFAHRGAAVRGGLLLIAGFAALCYAWGLNRDPLEPYYAAAVRSMAAVGLAKPTQTNALITAIATTGDRYQGRRALTNEKL